MKKTKRKAVQKTLDHAEIIAKLDKIQSFIIVSEGTLRRQLADDDYHVAHVLRLASDVVCEVTDEIREHAAA